MNLSELQAFLEDSNWDDDPEPAHPSDLARAATSAKTADPLNIEKSSNRADLPAYEDSIPTLSVDADLQGTSYAAPVKLVPRIKDNPDQSEPPLRATDSVRERLVEVEMAQKMGYLLCKCTWPPQIMVLTGTDHVYRCRRCSRVREM